MQSWYPNNSTKKKNNDSNDDDSFTQYEEKFT